jgi:hypothetical protein
VIALVLSVCWAGACRDVPIPHDFQGTMGCMMAAQQAAAEWMREHPHYTLGGWRCGPYREGT